MPAGDFGPGTKLRAVMINITVDENNVIDHVGVGYHIETPSGARHDGGFTWHSPRGQYATAPKDMIAGLQAYVTALLQAAATYEGVTLGAGIGLGKH